MSYLIPAKRTEIELEVKKSRFIAYADYTPDRSRALALVNHLKALYPDARHHCWAYSLGAPTMPVSAAMDDDGEPAGTAGKPIYNVISHKDIGDITIVVVRYFGGIKLGAGGLVRAYSSAAQAVTEVLPTRRFIAQSHLVLTLPFALEQRVRQCVQHLGGAITEASYQQNVQLHVTLPETQVNDFRQLWEAHNNVAIQHGLA